MGRAPCRLRPSSRASDGTPMPAVLTVPDGADGPVPGLLMIYEVFGMSDEMRRVARDLAADGYAVLIPDLFARGPVRALCVAATMRTMVTGHGPAMDDLEAARRWLADRPEVDGTRLGTIGFCMGGSFALLLARTGLYKVSAPFYGRPARPAAVVPGRGQLRRARPRRCAARPRSSPPTSTALGVPHDVKVYPDAGHSFFTRTPGLKGRVVRTAADPRRVPRGQRAGRAPQGRRVLPGAPRRPMTRRGWLLFAAMCVLWGIPYLLIKVAVAEVSVAVLVFARTALGALVLLPLAARPGAAAVVRAHWRPLLVFAVVEIIGPWALLSDAERTAGQLAHRACWWPPCRSSRCVAGRLAGDTERLGPLRWAGLALGLAGWRCSRPRTSTAAAGSRSGRCCSWPSATRSDRSSPRAGSPRCPTC